MFDKCEECGKRFIISDPIVVHRNKKFCTEECMERWARRNARPDGSGGFVDDEGISITNMIIIAYLMGLFDDVLINSVDDGPAAIESSEPMSHEFDDLPDQPAIEYDTGPTAHDGYDSSSSSDSYSSGDSGSGSCDSCSSCGGGGDD